MSFKLWLEESVWDEIENCNDINCIIQILTNNNIKHSIIKTKQPILSITHLNKDYIIDDFDYPSPQEAHDWLYSMGWKKNVEDYIDIPDFNQEFWNSANYTKEVYHGTTPEKWKLIQTQGLIKKCNTRGVSNRNVGCAVFASTNYETTQYHYKATLSINVAQMKKDGFMPPVTQEPEIEKTEALSSLAAKIGIEDFDPEIESGMEPDTIIFWDTIPAKYINILIF